MTVIDLIEKLTSYHPNDIIEDCSIKVTGGKEFFPGSWEINFTEE